MYGHRTARLELRVAPGLIERIDSVRGDVSRSRFIERAIELALSSPARTGSPESAEPARRADAPASRRSAPPKPEIPLPKIARAHWK